MTTNVDQSEEDVNDDEYISVPIEFEEYMQNAVENADQEAMGIRQDMDSFTREETDLSEMSAEGGILNKYFSKDGEIRMIEAVYYGETGKTTETFFIKDGLPILMERQKDNYDSPESRNIISGDKLLFYFEEGNLLEVFDGNGNITQIENMTYAGENIISDYEKFMNSDEDELY